MGLDFRIEGHEGRLPGTSYSGFNNFRKRLCEAVGIDGAPIYTPGFSDEAKYQAANTAAMAHALGPLLMHSDCDGELSVAECAQCIAPLREVCRTLNGGPNAEYDRHFGIALSEAMLIAVREGKPLEFC